MPKSGRKLFPACQGVAGLPMAELWVGGTATRIRLASPYGIGSNSIRAYGEKSAVVNPDGIRWTNKSVLRLAKNEDPIAVIERRARELTLRALDAGWNGPPFNPTAIADLLRIPVEANASIPDARIVPKESGHVIQFNPTQPRARVRFSIAHELAHTLFPDVAQEIRNRGGNRIVADDWQLEILCNLAAAEFVMPAGSMPSSDSLPSIELLMNERKRFDVSAEAFLIRATKMTNEPVIMFCASPRQSTDNASKYQIDYAISSKSAPLLNLAGKFVPEGSIAYSCTAIGYTDKKTETWFSHNNLRVECVGIPAYLGSSTPRVAGIIRFAKSESHDALKFIHGDVLDPRGGNKKVICQLVNDQARFWGGGVAKSSSKRFPEAHRKYAEWIVSVPRSKRLGSVHFAELDESLVIASLVGQEGFGASSTPRIRYAALEQCLEEVSSFALKKAATVHMPRIGAGQSGGQWEMVEEIVRGTLVQRGVPVTIYDLPSKKRGSSPDLFN